MEKALTPRYFRWFVWFMTAVVVVVAATFASSFAIEHLRVVNDFLHLDLGERFSRITWGLVLEAAAVGLILAAEMAILGIFVGSILIVILYFAFGENAQRGLDSDIDVLIASLEKATAEGVDVAGVLERARRLRAERQRSKARRVVRIIIRRMGR